MEYTEESHVRRYEFFGVFRNDAGKQVDHMGFPMYTNVKQRLIQCDVYGRAKVANFWGKKLRTGDALEIALMLKEVTQIKKPNLAGIAFGAVPRLQHVPLDNGCIPGTGRKAVAMDDDVGGGDTSWDQIDNQFNGLDLSLIKGDKKLIIDQLKSKGGFVENANIHIYAMDKVIKKWRVGVVSQSAFEPPSQTNIQLAMHSSQQRTHLPQIEILMI